jgi:hypothetical protein
MFKRIMGCLAIGAIGVLLLVTGVVAAEGAPLTADQAKRFVATLPALDALGEQFEAEGKMGELQIEARPKAGEVFKPYSGVVAVLKEKYPSDHAKLASVAKAQGFSTQEWGQVGDRVMIAYLALRMQEEDPRSLEMMEGMDKSMLDMMPPEMREQLEGTFAMMETVKNAPEEDKAAVVSVKSELDAYMEKDAQH